MQEDAATLIVHDEIARTITLDHFYLPILSGCLLTLLAVALFLAQANS